jgi:hypothetical protein
MGPVGSGPPGTRARPHASKFAPMLFGATLGWRMAGDNDKSGYRDHRARPDARRRTTEKPRLCPMSGAESNTARLTGLHSGQNRVAANRRLGTKSDHQAPSLCVYWASSRRSTESL